MTRSLAPPLPPEKLRFMGEDDERFVEIGDRLVSDLRLLAGFRAHSAVLDIGCGYGRLPHALLRDETFAGTYLGIDILERHVGWCRSNLGNERFRFEHVDIQNDRYNPGGRIPAERVTLDIPRASADVVVLSSVFTHMWPEHVRHYLRIVRRALRRDGRVYATFFLMNDSWRRCVEDGLSTRFPLPHRHTDFSRFMDPENQLHVIAYEQQWVEAEVWRAGMSVESVQLGAWCGRPDGRGLQDALVFERSPRRPTFGRLGVSRSHLTQRPG